MADSIDLNADVGEGASGDAALIRLVTSASVACGGHAGDNSTMDEAIRAAAAAGVVIGAHPGHEDRANFGRREVPATPVEVERFVTRQVAALETVARRHAASVRYMKLHGALYHQAGRDAALAEAVVRVAERFGLPLLGLAGSALERAAADAGVGFFREAFPDRRYLPDGSLAPRTSPDAVLTDERQVVSQALDLAGREVADSLCFHGDHPAAATLAGGVRRALLDAGFRIGGFLGRGNR